VCGSRGEIGCGMISQCSPVLLTVQRWILARQDGTIETFGTNGTNGTNENHRNFVSDSIQDENCVIDMQQLFPALSERFATYSEQEL
jgi:hypothetical protein